MTKITFENQQYAINEDTSVLDTLLDAGLKIPHGCKSGVCHSCLMRAVDGNVPADAQKGLKEMQQKKNFFLACSCYPDNDLTVALPSDADVLHYDVTVSDKQNLNDNVIQLRLSIPQDFDYKAGQFINLLKDIENQRSYSLASVPGQDPYLELHVKVLDNGLVSNWIKNDVNVGDSLTISEAHGDCYYSRKDKDASTLLIGTGTGLAPLYGVVRDALAQGHNNEIYLYHGASSGADLYLINELQALAVKYPNFHYFACVSRGDISGNQVSGRANDVALTQHKNLKDWQVFICGNPDMVEATRRKCFLAGANFKDILVDAFKFAAK